MLDLANRYSAVKQAMSATTGASEELLHVHFGLLIFVAAALLLRRRMHSALPIAAVWLFALANEAIDATLMLRPFNSALDVVNTVFWPSILYLVARRRRASMPSS